MQAVLQNLIVPFPRLFPWAERLIERLQSKDAYLRMLKWNRAIDAFMGSEATHQARLRIREAFDQAFADAGFVPADVWRGSERFTDGVDGGELLQGSRLFRDPLSKQEVTVHIRLQARYDGRLACVLAANTMDPDNPYVYATQLFAARTEQLPETTRSPWGVAQAFTGTLAGVLAAQDYAAGIRDACFSIRREMDEVLLP